MNLYDNNTEFKKIFNSIINNYFCYLKKMEYLINFKSNYIYNNYSYIYYCTLIHLFLIQSFT